MFAINDDSLQSFLEVPAGHDFPIQNLPYGVFHTDDASSARVGIAIGDWVLDLAAVQSAGLLDVPGSQSVFAQASLNEMMALGRAAWTSIREQVTQLLSADESTLRDNQSLRSSCLLSRNEAQMLLPVDIRDYTDFYSSKYHATNVGTMIRGADQALQENWLHLPVGYHGRASSVVVSGTDIRRPSGQLGAGSFDACRALDFELEVGFIVGTGNEQGHPIRIDQAAEHVFGLVLVNDWSARDVQKWEYVPLGPFLSKSFATSISPWVVPLDALMPFRLPPPQQDPLPLDYLRWNDDFTLDMELRVVLTPAESDTEETITTSNFRHLYWTMAQQLAHHSVNGCNLQTGDLLASGTVSGPEKESRGCLLELTWRGAEPLQLGGGLQRVFLAEGDRGTMRGWCGNDRRRIGFGEATGKILPAAK